MHRTRKKGGGLKYIKLRRTRKKINDINEKIVNLRIKARNIENKLTDGSANRALKKELKRKQGSTLKKIEVLKKRLATEQKWKNMLTINDKPSCEQINGGIYRENKCYLKTGTTCRNSIKSDNGRQTYCLVDELLSSMDDSGSMIFTELMNQTRINQPGAKNTTRSGSTSIPVSIRIQTNDTGLYKFVYSSRMGEINIKPNNIPQARRWTQVPTEFNQIGQKNISGQYNPIARNTSPRQRQMPGFPKIPYVPQPGGPYALFKPLGGSRWTTMPTWSQINEKLTSLLRQLFSKNKMISIPSPMDNSTSKDKKFLINSFVWLPLKFDDPYLERYKPIAKYFTGIPYKFIIIPGNNTLGVVLDVKLNGRLMSQEDARIKMNQIQENYAIEQAKLAQMTPEERYAYENSYSKKLGKANTYLTNSCNQHLESIKDILRSFGNDDNDITAYNDAKNTQLRTKFMTGRRGGRKTRKRRR